MRDITMNLICVTAGLGFGTSLGVVLGVVPTLSAYATLVSGGIVIWIFVFEVVGLRKP